MCLCFNCGNVLSENKFVSQIIQMQKKNRGRLVQVKNLSIKIHFPAELKNSQQGLQKCKKKTQTIKLLKLRKMGGKHEGKKKRNARACVCVCLSLLLKDPGGGVHWLAILLTLRKIDQLDPLPSWGGGFQDW